MATPAAPWGVVLSRLDRIIFDPDITPPTVPALNTPVIVGQDRIDLSWSASTDTGGSGIEGYEIQKDGSTSIVLGNQLSHSDTGLSPGSTHTYRVRARDVAQNVSNYSSQVQGTTQGVVSGPSDVTTIQLTSAVGGTLLPFSFGQPFKQGDIPSGQFIVADIAEFRGDVQTSWPDGSVKHARISGRKTLSAGAPSIITIRKTGSNPGGTALTEANLITALGATTTSVATPAGTVTLSSLTGTTATIATDATTGLLRSFLGTQMSEFHYRGKPGTDAHLRVYFIVRLYAGNQISVKSWVENGFLTVASPTNKSGTYSLTVNGTSRYSAALDIKHHCRVVLGTVYDGWYWYGTDPQVTPAHNQAYLASTKQLPSYYATTINGATLAAMGTTFTPMGNGDLSTVMGGVGFEQGIGILPNWVAKYLVSADARAWKNMCRNGMSSGSYCLHYRDEATGRPLLFANHPTRSINTGAGMPTPSGGAAFTWATSHAPAPNYALYLLSGDWWHLEEQQFQCTHNYLAAQPGNRENASYLVCSSNASEPNNDQGGPRAQAWQWRDLAYTASITPDSDSLRAQFITALGNNATRRANIYRDGVTDWLTGCTTPRNNLGLEVPLLHGNPSSNPAYWVNGQGLIEGYYQYNFYDAVINIAGELDLLTGQAALDHHWFRQWTSKSAVGPFGSAGGTSTHEWCYREAAHYQIYGCQTLSTAANTVTWSADWGELYTYNLTGHGGGADPGDLPFVIGDQPCTANASLLYAHIDDPDSMTSYWGNILPALAYSVDAGVEGAYAAYRRLLNSSNFVSKWPQFADNPSWGIKPRTTLPYTPPTTTGQVTLIGTNSLQSIKHPAVTAFNWWYSNVNSYGSGAFVKDYSTAGAYVTGPSGGHNHPAWTGGAIFDFLDATWKRLDPTQGPGARDTDFSAGETNGAPYFELTGTQVPIPPHPYHCNSSLPKAFGGGAKGSVVTITRHAVTPGAVEGVTSSHRFDLATGVWSRLTTAQFPASQMFTESSVVWDEFAQRYWLIPQAYHNFTNLSYLRLSDLTVQNTASFPFPPFPGGSGGGSYDVAMMDPRRRIIVLAQRNGNLIGFDPNAESLGWRVLTLSGSLPTNTNERWAYVPFRDAFYKIPGVGGSTLYKLTPPSSSPFTNAWTVSTISLSQAVSVYGDGPGSPGAYAALQYVPYIECLAWFSHGSAGTGAVNQVALIRP